MAECWYRVEDYRTAAPLDAFGNSFGAGGTEVHLLTLSVDKKTAKGVWLSYGFGVRRFVLAQATKRYACPTIDEAYESFRARKTRQLRILRAQIEHVERALARVANRSLAIQETRT